ncbi:MAG: hypothetical protein ACTSYZ_04605 [Candidatus Helarchaeota archaeon]
MNFWNLGLLNYLILRFQFEFFIFMTIFNFSLIVFNSVSLGLLIYINVLKFKIFKYNPYKTFPVCLLAIFLGLNSIIWIDIYFVLGIPSNFLLLSQIWTSIFINMFFALYTILVWKSKILQSIVIHINMLLNSTYLTLAVLDDLELRQIYSYFSIFVALIVTILFVLFIKIKQFAPAPGTIPNSLEKCVSIYINVLKNKKEKIFLDQLSMSDNSFVRNHALKTLYLFDNKKITKNNLRNNLFLLILIDNNIPTGKFRKIYYKKK